MERSALRQDTAAGRAAESGRAPGAAAPTAEGPAEAPDAPPPAGRRAEDFWRHPAAEEILRTVSRAQIVNRLNFLNFIAEPVLLAFTHRLYGRAVVLPALPQPCLGERVELRWAEEADAAALARSYRLACVLLPQGQGFIRLEPAESTLQPEGLVIALPETGQEIAHRRRERHRCRGVEARLIQNGALFSGVLLDFNAESFRVELRAEPPQSFAWIDPERPVQVVFSRGERTIYTGECRIVRSAPGGATRGYVLEPAAREIRRFRRAEFRSRRHCLSPSPNMICRHPLSGKRLEFKIVDISGSGFAVEEEESSAVLPAGLVLEEIALHFPDGSRITACAQVVFRRPADPARPDGATRCGFALIDIGPEDHVKLLATLHQAGDSRAYVCSDIDLDELWEFFFDTGFIYPEKYRALHPHKEAIRARYEMLYTRCPDIARHFVYQENGTIMGHLAMIRLWEESWLIHHHAARTAASYKAGLVVLDQAGRFAYDAHRLRRLHLEHGLTYYRPQNRFPARIFGGVVRYIGNPKGCWEDEFAFITPRPAERPATELPPGWSLEAATAADVGELETWYEERSGGLLLHALDMAPHNWRTDTLGREFEKYGLRRRRRFFALRREGGLAAVMVATVSEAGFNFSDLTNGTFVFLLDPGRLDAAVLEAALAAAHRAVDYPAAPALVHPLAAARQAGIPCAKSYILWGLRVAEFSDRYFRFLDRIMRRL